MASGPEDTILPGSGAGSGGEERPGDLVGPYRLVSVVGEGGFGTVWIAERRDPFVQRVALKLIKAGMDSRTVLARFEQERQALAVMNHPHVAKVFDGGLTARGRPYFAMEYVAGESITQFCDRRRLATKDRLRLFLQVCEAVQHAHTKGIIHRDLKPSNVLVSMGTDDQPDAKVIDFGIAKAVSGHMTEQTIFTETGQMIGTPEYMSPEQADPGALDIDTRTDVYSLGVILYELLSGMLPFDPADLRSRAYREIQRMIREDDPPTPSARLSTIATRDAELATRIGQSRKEGVASLASVLKRELEWIPLKAMRKDRQERYDGPAELARDVENYLEGRPLVAAPESTAYRVRKYVRRNRALVAGAGAVLAVLVVGVVATGLALQRALSAESGLRDQLAETQKARQAERERAEQLTKVSDFQAEMLGSIDTRAAGEGLMTDVRSRFLTALEKSGVPQEERTARAEALRQELVRVNATDAAAAMIDRMVLKPSIKAIDDRFKDDPATDATLRQALADLYRTIGQYEDAFPLQDSALATRRRTLGGEHLDTLQSINNMGYLLQCQGKLAEAEPYYREALGKFRRTLGDEHPYTIHSISSMGVVLQYQGKLAEAEPYFRDALEKRRRTLGEEHPDTLNSINNMGYLLQSQGKLAEAEPYFRDALEKFRRTLGEEHPDTLNSISNMGYLLEAQGKLAEAEPYYREALEKRRRALGEEHPDTLVSMNNVGSLLQSQGKLAEAEPYYREALEKSRRTLGEEHPHALILINNMGSLLRAQGKLAEAEPYWREALEKRRRTLGEEHPDTLISISSMGSLLEAQGKLAEAEPYYREALEKFRRTLGEEHPYTLGSVSLLVCVEIAESKFQEGLDLITPFEPAARRAFTGGNARRLAYFLTALGRARVGVGFDAGRFALAEANFLEAHSIYVAAKDRGPAHKDTIECVKALVDLHSAWDQAEPGQGHAAKAAEWRAKLPAT